MKTKIYKSLIAMSMVGGAFLTSCGDNFLDTKSPSSLDDKNIFSIYDLAKVLYIIYIPTTVNRIIVHVSHHTTA